MGKNNVICDVRGRARGERAPKGSGGRPLREADIEAFLRRAVSEAGGLAVKFIPTAAAGFPDRLVLLPGGRLVFAELKAPGAGPRRLQEVWHRRLRALGFEVRVISSREEVSDVVGSSSGL